MSQLSIAVLNVLAKHWFFLQLIFQLSFVFPLLKTEEFLVLGISDLVGVSTAFSFADWKYIYPQSWRKSSWKKVLFFMVLLFFKVAVKLPLFCVIKVHVALLSKNLLLSFFYDLAQFKKLPLSSRQNLTLNIGLF